MNNTWAVIIDDNLAKIYSASENGKNIKLHDKIDQFQSRTARLTISPNSSGQIHIQETVHGSYDDLSNPRKMNQEQLACELTEYLDTSFLENKFTSVIILSDTNFENCFNQHASTALKKKTRILIKNHNFIHDQILPSIIDKSVLTELKTLK